MICRIFSILVVKKGGGGEGRKNGRKSMRDYFVVCNKLLEVINILLIRVASRYCIFFY